MTNFSNSIFEVGEVGTSAAFPTHPFLPNLNFLSNARAQRSPCPRSVGAEVKFGPELADLDAAPGMTSCELQRLAPLTT